MFICSTLRNAYSSHTRVPTGTQLTVILLGSFKIQLNVEGKLSPSNVPLFVGMIGYGPKEVGYPSRCIFMMGRTREHMFKLKLIILLFLIYQVLFNLLFTMFKKYNHNLSDVVFGCTSTFMDTEYGTSSSSSCHQTSVFHLSTHFFAVSLNLLRSSNEQGCSRRVHCIMCAVFSVARPHSQVVSPS